MRKIIVLGILFLLLTTIVSAEWVFESSEDLMSDETVTVVMAEATTYGGALTSPMLFIRKQGDSKVDVVIYWGGYSLERNPRQILVRFGDGEPGAWNVAGSSNREGTFISLKEEFIVNMLTHEKVAAQISSATGRQMTALWDLTGFEAAYLRARELHQR